MLCCCSMAGTPACERCLAAKQSVEINTTNCPEWPIKFPLPTDADLAFLAKLSKRETSSSFFQK